MTEILRLIEETKHWREINRAAGRQIEALACTIRLRALEDAVRAISK